MRLTTMANHWLQAALVVGAMLMAGSAFGAKRKVAGPVAPSVDSNASGANINANRSGTNAKTADNSANGTGINAKGANDSAKGANDSAKGANDSAKGANNNTKGAENKPFADYRSWGAVNPKSVAVSAKQFRACRAPRSVDPNGPHAGGFVNVYVNKAGRAEYVEAEQPTFGAGTVIVKEKLLKPDDKAPFGLGIMVKHEPGYAPDVNDWQFLFVDHNGGVTSAQTQLDCANCHRIQAENDFVFRRPRAN